MLPSRVLVPPPPNPEQEDIFSSALGILFPDDIQNSHGTPGHSVFYRSPRYGEIALEIPRHPDVEEGRKLFAHYLWNAGVVAADAIESASNDDQRELGDGKVKWNQIYWDVRGQDVLELGAGTALPSLISCLSNARSLTITDHPSSPALVTDTIAHNVHQNLKINLSSENPSSSSANPISTPTSASDNLPNPNTNPNVSIHGLTWGDELFTSPTHYGKPSSPRPAKHSFDKIIIADCLWMPSQHENLVRTIDSYLRQKEERTGREAQAHGHGQAERQENETEQNAGRRVPCALVIAGFHTGRRVVADFVETATGSSTGTDTDIDIDINAKAAVATAAEQEHQGAEDDKSTNHPLSAAELFEIDVDCNVRPWLPERPGENKDAAKRWCVVAVLVRR